MSELPEHSPSKGSDLYYLENKTIIDQMISLNMEPIGTIIQPTQGDIEQTFKALKYIIIEKTQWISEKQQTNKLIVEERAKREQLQKEIDSKQKDYDKFKKEADTVRSSFTLNKEKKEEEIKKAKSDYSETLKTNKQLQSKIVELNHELKKRETDINELKDKLQRILNEKTITKSSIELTSTINKASPEENEFSLVVCNTFNNRMKFLEKENSLLKEAIDKINKDIIQIYDTRRDAIKIIDPSYQFNERSLEKISPSLLASQFEKSKEKISQILYSNAEALTKMSLKVDEALAQLTTAKSSEQDGSSQTLSSILNQLTDTMSQFKELANQNDQPYDTPFDIKPIGNIFQLSDSEYYNN